MLRIHRYWLRTTAIVAGLVVMALPAVAIEAEEVWKLCEDFLVNHLDEPKWEKACFDAAEQLAAELPPVLPTVQTQTAQSSQARPHQAHP